MTKAIDRPVLETQWVNKEVQDNLTVDEQTIWSRLGSTQKLRLGIGRTLLVWKCVGGAPQSVYRVTALTPRLTFHTGLIMVLETPFGTMQVGHLPQKLPQVDIFVWCSLFSELRWLSLDKNSPADPSRLMTVPVCFKMASNYSRNLVEGETYISTPVQFKEMWPDHKDIPF